MKRLVRQLLFLAVMLPYAAFETWRHWGTPEFWPLVGFSLVMSLLLLHAGKQRREDLQARLPGARTLGH